MSEIIKNLKKYGYCKFTEIDGLNLINIDEFKLLNVEERGRDNGFKDVPKELSDRLTTFAYYLKTKYLDPTWPDSIYNKFIVWEGVDKDNQGWHTDMFEGYDVFFLYYLTDTHPDTGGYIEFKTAEFEERHYPKAGDLFLVNNCRGYWHRAGSSTITRKVASFDFNIGLEDD